MRPKAYSYVRFSTPEQRKGDSLLRQTQAATQYAADHGLVLDDALKPDRGLSAFSGAHRIKGALGQFMKAVEAGKVPKGSFLIVESLDRLSREEVLEALEYFIQIIKAGIAVVTLMDGQHYTRESINANIGQLIVSLTVMSRAHEESATKSKRGISAWRGKREKAEEHGIPMTAIAPAWLRIVRDADSAHFEGIPERVETVKSIFQKRLAGKGPEVIAKELNKGTPPPWVPVSRRKGVPPGWRKSYVVKILASRAVLGEYQPHRMVVRDGLKKREPVGDPLPNYFPPIVEAKTFHAVQALRRGCHKGGPTGRATNLFQYLVECGFCGGRMVFVDKGPSPKGAQYLVCDAAARGIGCEYRGIRYDEVERVLLEYCRGLSIRDVLSNENERETRLAALHSALAGTEGKRAEIRQKIDNLVDQIASTGNPSARSLYEGKLTKHLDAEASLEVHQQRIQRELSELVSAVEDTAERIGSLQDLFDKLASEGTVDLRLRLREELRRLISVVQVYPAGAPTKSTPPHPERWEPHDEQEEKALRKMVANESENRVGRHLKVFFRGGGFRILYPAKENPLRWDVA